MSLKYAIIGSGAIGGYYGGMLTKGGKDVHFLFNSDYNQVKAHGLRIDSINGDFEINPVQAYNSTKDMPKCDIILVCLKTTNNHILKELLAPLLHLDSIVILIQNGLDMESDLSNDFSNIQIAGAMAFIYSNKTGPGHISHFGLGSINIGSYSCHDLDVLNQVNTDLRESNIDSQIVDLEIARWKKLIWNIPYNGMTVALNTMTDQLMINSSTRVLIYELMIEVIRAANRVGQGRFHIDEFLADKLMETTDRMAPYSPSMKVDYDNKRALEIEYIYNRPILKAREAGYEMARTSMLSAQLQFIEDTYSNK